MVPSFLVAIVHAAFRSIIWSVFLSLLLDHYTTAWCCAALDRTLSQRVRCRICIRFTWPRWVMSLPRPPPMESAHGFCYHDVQSGFSRLFILCAAAWTTADLWRGTGNDTALDRTAGLQPALFSPFIFVSAFKPHQTRCVIRVGGYLAGLRPLLACRRGCAAHRRRQGR